MPGVDLSDVVLPDDLQRALISKVESGQYPSKGAIIEKALRTLLIEEPTQETPERDRATEPQPRREPSPFILDEWAFGPGDIPRSGGQKVRCRFLDDETRWPDRFPGE
jgi:Arc/MetJ-type ribon-helix-helix transcriptional regulator